MATARTEWMIGTSDEVNDDCISKTAYPSNWTVTEIVRAYAETWDMGCGTRPMIHDKLVLEIWCMKAEEYNPEIAFEDQAANFKVQGQLVPEYSVDRY